MNNQMNTGAIIGPLRDDEVCPKCGRKEDIKEVCRHCNYEYPEEDYSLGFWGVIVLILFIVSIVWIFFTMLDWLISFDNPTLLEVLKDQWEWIKAKRIW